MRSRRIVSHSRCANPASKPKYAARSAKRNSPSPFKPACQGEPFVLGALTRHSTVAQIGNRRDCQRNGKRGTFPFVVAATKRAPLPPRESRSRLPKSHNRRSFNLPGSRFPSAARIQPTGPQFAEKIPERIPCAFDPVPDLRQQLVKPVWRTRMLGIVPAINRAL